MKSIMSFKFIFSTFWLSLVITNISCASSNESLVNIISNNLLDKSTSEQRTALHKIIGWPDSCNETFTFPTSGFKFFKQTDNQFILQVVCTYGTYQGMSLFYKVDISSETNHSNLINFPKSYSDKNRETEIWGNVLSDSKVNNFTILNLYSGYGHCGRLTTYDLSVKKPKITQLKQQDNCDAKPVERDPEKWPLVNK